MQNNHSLSSMPDGSQSKKSDPWNSQPIWVKTMIKICITLELGWYVGWILHAVSML